MIYILSHKSQLDSLFTYKNIFPSVGCLSVLKLSNLYYDESLDELNIKVYENPYELLSLLDKYDSSQKVIFKPTSYDMLNILESKVSNYHIMY
jgi:hypothetical protein